LSERRRTDCRFGVALSAAALFNLFWYGAFLSFPLIGEDGTANYSFLLENLENGHAWTTTFPIKWLEGLAQPNLFVTITFDPFSWVMLLPLAHADSFRVSMAMRATACWLGTYLFVGTLFKGRRDLSIVAASLNMLLNFTLGHTWAIPTVAGIPNSTHYAVFPFVLHAVVVALRGIRWINPSDLALVLLLGFFLITFPLSAVIGLAVVMTFTFCMVIQMSGVDRLAAVRGATKVTIVCTAVLLAPRFGLWHAWSSLIDVSARVVFAHELYTYQRSYDLPYMWNHTPLAIRLCLVLAFGILLYRRPWPKALRVVVCTLLLVVGTVQLISLIQARQGPGGLLDRLPRLQYFEFYVPVFYSITGAFALCDWPLLLPTRLKGWYLLRWAIGCALFFWLTVTVIGGSSHVIRGVWWGVIATLGIVAVKWVGRSVHAPQIQSSVASRRMVGFTVLSGLIGFSVWTWAVSPQQFHFLFAKTCDRISIWCRDAVGPTIGAADTPITRYLRSRLTSTADFSGRGETLLVPSQRLTIPGVAAAEWSNELFEQFKFWYTRAYDARLLDSDLRDYQLRTKPADWRWKDREQLWHRLQAISSQGDIVTGVLPEGVVSEILEWSRRNPTFVPRAILNPAQKLSEVQLMVEERNRAFATTGNGMMLRALPLQHIPVASSYEQALDYLYYLLWTRYLNEGGERYSRSINFTALEVVRPDRLALLGVRFVIARESAFERPPPLPKVFSWRGYGVYEVPLPNLAGFSPTGIQFGKTLTDQLGLMRQATFDPRTIAVVSEADRALFDTHRLASMRRSRISVAGNDLLFEADTAGGLALAVLPFKYSRCWTARWATQPGQILRVDTALIGVLFRGPVSVRLRWSAGYGSVRCLREDRRLVFEARKAANSY